MTLGFNFSKKQCDWLGLDWRNTFERILAQNKFKAVRLSAYWSDIEESRMTVATVIYNFEQIQNEIEFALKHNLEVTLTIGLKAQRWPEFHIPEYLSNKDVNSTYLQEKALIFLEKAIRTLKKYKNIVCWQIENEPFDSSGPENLILDPQFIQKEIDLAKRIDSDRPIMINLWGNDYARRKTLEQIIHLENINKIGFNFYPRQKRKRLPGYRGASFRMRKLKSDLKLLKENGFEPVITEIQAEPWENFDYRYNFDKVRSVNKEIVQKNFEKYKDLGFEEIYIWGVEFLVWAEWEIGILSTRKVTL